MIGPRVRQYRIKKGLTLQELAELTMTTAGYLSQLERDLTEPSLSTLRRIAGALEVPIFTLLNEELAKAAYIPAAQRHKISFSDAGVVYELLTPPAETESEGPDYLMMTFSLPPGQFCSEDRVSHDAEECFYLTAGTLEVLIGNDTYLLQAGDCITIPGNAPHNLYNPGEIPAQGITCMKPGIFISTLSR